MCNLHDCCSHFPLARCVDSNTQLDRRLSSLTCMLRPVVAVIIVVCYFVLFFNNVNRLIDRNTRYVTCATNSMTKSLEDLIRARIRDAAFDDVAPRAPIDGQTARATRSLETFV
jgi:hypothetical protein